MALDVDRRVIGWAAPLLYSLGFIVMPVAGTPATWVGCALVVVLAFRLWAFWCLGLGYSVGLPTWTRLADSGPYAWVRHPMTVSGLAGRLIFCFANPVYWNWSAFGLMVVAAFGVVAVEESFLEKMGEWRRHRNRVRWRLLPGVW